MTKQAFILDCDPGLDDAVAILLALTARDELDLKGITTVAGNVPLSATYRNARALCELAGFPETPVYAGCPRAIIGEGTRADAVHGQDGIGGVTLPEPTAQEQSQHAVDFIIETCRDAADNGLTICPIGPMTNIALALIKAPDIAGKIKEIVFMGGVAFGAGNTTPAAEFNIHADPHAAHTVAHSGVPLVMMGLDVTQQARITQDRLAQFRALTAPANRAVADMIERYRNIVLERTKGRREGVLHDPCTVAYLLAPDLFRGRALHVDIDITSPSSIGRTIADDYAVSGHTPNMTVMLEMDADGFFALLLTHLRRLD